MGALEHQFKGIQYLFFSEWVQNQGLEEKFKRHLKLFLGELCGDVKENDFFVGSVIQTKGFESTDISKTFNLTIVRDAEGKNYTKHYEISQYIVNNVISEYICHGDGVDKTQQEKEATASLLLFLLSKFVLDSTNTIITRYEFYLIFKKDYPETSSATLLQYNNGNFAKTMNMMVPNKKKWGIAEVVFRILKRVAANTSSVKVHNIHTFVANPIQPTSAKTLETDDVVATLTFLTQLLDNRHIYGHAGLCLSRMLDYCHIWELNSSKINIHMKHFGHLELGEDKLFACFCTLMLVNGSDKSKMVCSEDSEYILKCATWKEFDEVIAIVSRFAGIIQNLQKIVNIYNGKKTSDIICTDIIGHMKDRNVMRIIQLCCAVDQWLVENKLSSDVKSLHDELEKKFKNSLSYLPQVIEPKLEGLVQTLSEKFFGGIKNLFVSITGSSAPPNTSDATEHNSGGGGASGGGGTGSTSERANFAGNKPGDGTGVISGGPNSPGQNSGGFGGFGGGGGGSRSVFPASSTHGAAVGPVRGGGVISGGTNSRGQNYGVPAAFGGGGGSPPVFSASSTNGSNNFGAAVGASGGGAFGSSGLNEPNTSASYTGFFGNNGTQGAFVNSGNFMGGGPQLFNNKRHGPGTNGATNAVRMDSNPGGMASVDTTDGVSDADVFQNISLQLIRDSHSMTKLSVEESDELYTIIENFIEKFSTKTQDKNIADLKDDLFHFVNDGQSKTDFLQHHVDIITATLTKLPDGTEDKATRVRILTKYVKELLGDNVANLAKITGSNNQNLTKCRLGSYICFEYLYLRSVQRSESQNTLWRAKCSNSRITNPDAERGRDQQRSSQQTREDSTDRSAGGRSGGIFRRVVQGLR